MHHRVFRIVSKPMAVCTTAIMIALTSDSRAAADGQIVVWGQQSGNGSTLLQPRSLLPFTVVSAGGLHSMALRSDGSLMGWGDDALGQSSVPPGLGPVKAVDIGFAYSMALKPDGSVVCWGWNSHGQCSVPSGLGPVSSIAAGQSHCAVVRVNGSVACWGQNTSGQCNVPTGLQSVSVVDAGAAYTIALTSNGSLHAWGDGAYQPPAGTGPLSTVTAGASHSAAIKLDGTIVVWGSNEFGQLNVPAGLGVVTAISAGASHTVALKADGSVACWGLDNYGQCRVPDLAQLRAVAVSAGRSHTVVALADGTLRCWGDDMFSQCSVPGEIKLVRSVANGTQHSAVIRDDGTVECWGDNMFGECVVPAGLGQVRQIAAGYGFTMALRSDGAVACWGNDWSGTTSVPPDLGALSSIAAGARHCIALRTSGSVICWGFNADGQCSVPTGLGPVSAIDGGDAFTVALREAGTVACWGRNLSSECDVPPGLSSVSRIAAGSFHSVALRADGTVQCWGSNSQGQCSEPSSLSGVVGVAAGRSHTVALISDGRVLCWGSNANGQCGVPIGIGSVSEVTAGFNVTIAILSSAVSSCGNAYGGGTATLAASGAAWDNVGIWSWSNGGGPQVPGSLSNVDLGDFGSVGSTCDARCAALLARSGSTLIVPADLSDASTWGNHSVTVGGTATMAGRVWLLGSGASALPADLNIPVLVAGNPVGTFDVIQTTVPAPKGKFLTLVPSASLGGGTTYSLRLLDLPGSAALTGASSGAFIGTAVAAEAMDWNGDGFDDLALAIDFGASQPGRLQVLLNDGEGNLGGTSVQVNTPPLPQCLAVGDVNQDGKTDAVVCIGSSQTGQVYLNAFSGSTQGAPFTAGATLPVGGNPLSAIVIPPAGGSSLVEGPGGPSVGVGSGGSAGSGGTVKVFNPVTAQETQSVAVPGRPNTLVRRGRQLGTGGNSATNVGGPDLPGFLALLTPNGQGVYTITQQVAVPGVPQQMDAADIDGDGYADIVSANSNPQVQGSGTALPVLTLFRGGAVQVGQAVPIAPTGGTAGLDISLIDADSDGDRDLVSVHQTVVGQSKAVLIQIDTPGPGAPLTIGAQTELDASRPILSTRGNLDGVGGEDLFLVDSGTSSLTLAGGDGPAVRPFRGSPEVPSCVGDINGDGQRDGVDLGNLLAQWGVAGSADIDSSGSVDGVDLAFLLASWGPCP